LTVAARDPGWRTERVEEGTMDLKLKDRVALVGRRKSGAR